MSCNGCRVLRKGCNRDCVLRPSLEWIKSPESQANATLFLAKFYGRAGLMNLINAGPAHLYPEIFKSLLYEACGRIINPVEGALGLFSANDWSRCQAAVDAVLDGKPLIIDGTVKDRQAIVNPNHHFNDPNGIIPLRRHNGDIRHFSTAALAHRVRKNHPRFKKTAGIKNRAHRSVPEDNNNNLLDDQIGKFTITGWELKEEEHHDDSDEKICFLIDDDEEEAVKRAPSHDSASVETVEPELVDRVDNPFEPGRLGDVSLELTLGSF